MLFSKGNEKLLQIKPEYERLKKIRNPARDSRIGNEGGPNMKAFLSLTLSLLMLLSLAPGIQCQAGAVAPPEPARLVRNTSSLSDGWTITEGNEISEEAIAALEQALEGCSDVDYQPVALLGT